MLAAVRVRGRTGIKGDISDTLDMLRLTRINHAVLVPETPSFLGMLRKAKDYITWGEIDQETLEELLEKRAMLPGREKVTTDYLKETEYQSIQKLAQALLDEKTQLEEVGLKPIFRLHPPRKGHKDTKKTFNEGGTLGYRGEGINLLLKQMV
ncbi:MAG: 50S ribosomal protein L30 [Methanobacteriaceae archaeon]